MGGGAQIAGTLSGIHQQPGSVPRASREAGGRLPHSAGEVSAAILAAIWVHEGPVFGQAVQQDRCDDSYNMSTMNSTVCPWCFSSILTVLKHPVCLARYGQDVSGMQPLFLPEDERVLLPAQFRALSHVSSRTRRTMGDDGKPYVQSAAWRNRNLIHVVTQYYTPDDPHRASEVCRHFTSVFWASRKTDRGSNF